MKKNESRVEVANLICKFGENKVLLDMFDEIVSPAFFDKKMKRKYDDTTYFFHNVKLVELDKSGSTPVVGIAGRIIKDTTLRREQIYKEGQGLVKDEDSIRSSPSAIFLLILNSHRLVYAHETKDAPSKDTFRSTLLSFLRVKYKKYVSDEWEARNEVESEKRVTKKSIQEELPPPTLNLIPLTSDSGIADFVNRYDVLKTLEIRFFDRNDENDSDPFFEQFQARRDRLGSDVSILRHSSKDGLDKSEAIDEITEATQQGNQNVTLKGVDFQGDTLLGNNEQFQIRSAIGSLRKRISSAATQLYDIFKNLVEEGAIKLPPIRPKTRDAIVEIHKRLPNAKQ
jgi:hypothetical protein